MRFHKAHFAIAAALLAIESSIALFVHDRFVRPFVGDVLVIPLIYCSIATFFDVRPIKLGLGVFVFACAIEFGQRANLVALLGLEQSRFARTLIGTSYSSLDLVAYAVGAALTVASHLTAQRRNGGP
ncbi:MAG TPA: DUF2809 domain-containing protein [Polyangiaceae bacterium]|nr:DUF2809 domain-containing protein [Polyangiaceae bacterium]